MNTTLQVLVFSLDEKKFAIDINDIERVLRAMQITTLPDAPKQVLGLIDVGGRILPVIDIRKRLNLPVRKIHPDDRIILLGAEKPLCFFVDEIVETVAFSEEELKKPAQIYPDLDRFLTGVGRLHDETVLVFDRSKLFGMPEKESENTGFSSTPAKRLFKQ